MIYNPPLQWTVDDLISKLLQRQVEMENAQLSKAPVFTAVMVPRWGSSRGLWVGENPGFFWGDFMGFHGIPIDFMGFWGNFYGFWMLFGWFSIEFRCFLGLLVAQIFEHHVSVFGFIIFITWLTREETSKHSSSPETRWLQMFLFATVISLGTWKISTIQKGYLGLS